MRINFDMLKKFEIMMEKFREVKSNSFKNMYVCNIRYIPLNLKNSYFVNITGYPP